jgi:hypothetical protein
MVVWACVSGRRWRIQAGVIYRDDLPSLSISRLRAQNVITPATTAFLVRLGPVEQTVSVHLHKFPNGGGWSFFGCPTCSRQARTLRLLGEEIVCRSCLERRRIRWRAAASLSRRQRAEHRIPKLRAKLESPVPLRLKPALRWALMERKLRLEARLRECEFRVVRKANANVVADPADDPTFAVPRRWRDR